MLERQALWLGPSSAAPVRAGASQEPPLWVVLEPETQAFLGLVRRQAWRSPFWFGYLDRPGVAVYETEDESLLFSLERAWGLGAVWLVRDADGHRVGSLRGNLARDENGRRLAVLEPTGAAQVQRWLGTDGEELGTATAVDAGALVQFAGLSESRPFVRMLLLALLLRPE